MKTYPVYLNGNLTVTEKNLHREKSCYREGFARMSAVGRPSVNEAIRDAHLAFPGWRQLPGKGRGELLNKIAGELARRREEIARLMTLRTASPLPKVKARYRWPLIICVGLRRKRDELMGGSSASSGRKTASCAPSTGRCRGCDQSLEFSAAAGGEKSGGGACGRLSRDPKTRQPDPVVRINLCRMRGCSRIAHGVFQMVAGSAAEIGQEFLENPLCRKITLPAQPRSEKS